MEWLELHIDTNHAGLEPLEIFLSANGVDGVVIDDEQDFQSFLENNHQYWDTGSAHHPPRRDFGRRRVLYL